MAARAGDASDVAFRYPLERGTPEEASFAAVYPDGMSSARLFGAPLVGIAARLGAGVGRYPFTL